MDSPDTLIDQFNRRARAKGWLQFCDPANAFILKDCEELTALWHKMRKGMGTPRRRDFCPRVLKPYLSRLVLVERVEDAPPAFRFRLVGTMVTDTLSERTGQGFHHPTATAEQTERWTHSALLSLQVLKPLRFPIVMQERMVGETVSLPLADDNDEPRFVLAYGRYEPERNWRRPLSPPLIRTASAIA
ncbi:MAG TPA: PAS domain-containing protein [Rhizomicrobium sp.]|nr:PAS domain-containing protein [Rhizomicrobium sp.]